MINEIEWEMWFFVLSSFEELKNTLENKASAGLGIKANFFCNSTKMCIQIHFPISRVILNENARLIQQNLS